MRGQGQGETSSAPASEERAQASHDDWFAGYASALSAIWRLHRDAQMIRHVMVSNGITLRRLELARVEERDLAIIRNAFFGESGSR